MSDNPFVPKRNPFDIPPVVVSTPKHPVHMSVEEIARRQRNRSQSAIVITLAALGGVALMVLLAMSLHPQSDDGRSPGHSENATTGTPATFAQIAPSAAIPYTVLRQENPLHGADTLVLDILIDRQNVSKENIEQLVQSIAANRNRAAVKVFQDKRAWLEDRSANYTEIFDEGYLAFYVKNLTNNGPVQGVNEIRWFQAKGSLQHLCDTATRIR